MADQAQLLSLLTSISERLARVEIAVASGAGAGGAAAAAAPPASAGAGSGAGASENVANYAAFVANAGEKFLEATKACGKKANKAANNMRKLFDFNAEIVAKAETCRKPTDAELAAFGKTISGFVNNGLRAQFPDRNMEKGLSEVFAAMSALLHPTPVQHVKDSFEAMQFYTNKVLSDAKGKDDKANNIAWVKAAEALLNDFRQFCVPSMRGLKWKGKDDPTGAAPALPAAGGAKAAEPAPAPAAAAEPEAAPAPAPAPAVKVKTAKGLSKGGGGGGGLAGLFAEVRSIDQSSGKTAGLKHVSDKQKVYKNRSLVKTSVVSEDAIKKKKKKTVKKAAPKKVLPPKCEYDKRQHTWFIENQPDGARLTVDIEHANDKVYLYKCGDCVVILQGRLKALNVVNCRKTQLSFQDLLAVVEINNCTSVKVQSLGKCPAMTIDKTNGCQVYLSRTSLDCNFVCAQSSEMNVNFPHGPEGEEEEWLERPIPEQFQHKLVGTDLTSEVSDLYSH